MQQERKRASGIDYYVPNPVQFKAHQSKARTILVCGGNRIGKSTFGAAELTWALTKKYPEWYPKERRFNRPIKAIISVDKFNKITTVIEPKMRQFLPQGSYVFRKRQGYLNRIEMKDGSCVDILTLEMDDLSYEGFDIDFAWEDEPQSQRKREGIVRGLLDRQGIELITFTPLTEAWMKTELIDKADGRRIDTFFAEMRDNKFDIQGKPILSEEAIVDFENSLPEEIREIRVDGKFFTLRGRVYKELSDEHLLNFEYEYPLPVTCVLDPHDRKPHHVIWAYVDREGDVFVDAEMIVHCELDDLAKKIKDFEKARGYKMRKRLIDPNFGLKPSKPGCNTCVKDELARHGAGFYPANDDIELGHMVVRDYLHWNKRKPMTAVNKPKVFFNRERCPVTIRSMRNLQYDEFVGRTRDKRDPKETEMEKDSDGADCIRYLLIGKPSFGGLTAMRESELEEAPY